MNIVALLGNVVRDAEIKTFQKDGKEGKLAKFSIAVYRSKEKTDFIDVNAFDWAAEAAEKFAVRGAKIAVEGELHQDSWTDKDGNPRNGHKVMARRIHATGKPQELKPTAEVNTINDDSIPF